MARASSATAQKSGHSLNPPLFRLGLDRLFRFCCIACVETPGPGTYAVINANKYKHQLPQYSMKIRTVLPADETCTPEASWRTPPGTR